MATKAVEKQVSSIKWTPEMEAFLIEEVSGKHYLWDSRHKSYKSRTLRNLGFGEIASAISFRWPHCEGILTYKMVQDKFRSLRQYYVRQKSEANKLKSGSGCEGYTPRWKHYNAFSFLDEALIAEPSLDSLPGETEDRGEPKDANKEVEEEGDDSQMTEITINVLSQEADADPAEEQDSDIAEVRDHFHAIAGSSAETNKRVADGSVPSNPKKKKKSLDSQISETLQEASRLMASLSNETEEPDEAFAHYIKLRLRDIKSKRLKEEAKIEIQLILNKYCLED